MMVDFVTETISVNNLERLSAKLLSVCNDKKHDFIEFFLIDADTMQQAKRSLYVSMLDQKDLPQTRCVMVVDCEKSPPIKRFYTNNQPNSIENCINILTKMIGV